jgi:hypothetical protein
VFDADYMEVTFDELPTDGATFKFNDQTFRLGTYTVTFDQETKTWNGDYCRVYPWCNIFDIPADIYQTWTNDVRNADAYYSSLIPYYSIWIRDTPENRQFIIDKYAPVQIDIENLLQWLETDGKIIIYENSIGGPIHTHDFILSKRYVGQNANYWNITYKNKNLSIQTVTLSQVYIAIDPLLYILKYQFHYHAGEIPNPDSSVPGAPQTIPGFILDNCASFDNICDVLSHPVDPIVFQQSNRTKCVIYSLSNFTYFPHQTYYSVFTENPFVYDKENNKYNIELPLASSFDRTYLFTEHSIIGENTGNFLETGTAKYFEMDSHQISQCADENNNYIMFHCDIPTPFVHNVQVFSFELPNSTLYNTDDPIGLVYCTTGVNNEFNVPVLHTVSPLTYVTKDFPGIGFDNAMATTPYISFLRGDMYAKFIYPLHRLVATDVTMRNLVSLECKTIIAENALELYKNPLPDLYIPDDFGEFVADLGETYYYMRWNKKYDEAYWNAHIGAEFNFNEPIFGTAYQMTRIADGWKGNNVHYHYGGELRNSRSVFKRGDDYVLTFMEGVNRQIVWPTQKNRMGAVFFVQRTDFSLELLQKFYGYKETEWNSKFKDWIISHISVEEGCEIQEIVCDDEAFGNETHYYGISLTTNWHVPDDVNDMHLNIGSSEIGYIQIHYVDCT